MRSAVERAAFTAHPRLRPSLLRPVNHLELCSGNGGIRECAANVTHTRLTHTRFRAVIPLQPARGELCPE